MNIKRALVLVSLAGLAIAAHPVLGQSMEAARGAPAAAAAVRGADLPIRRVTLYRSGVGSFERRGSVSGDAQVSLRFTTDQINDILKSMVVLDLSGRGTVNSVGYGSKDPLERRMGTFSVDLSENMDLVTLLSKLRGSEVSVDLPDGKVFGAIVGAGEQAGSINERGQRSIERYVMVLTATGLRNINLANVQGLNFMDDALNQELRRALGLLTEYRSDRFKTVDVSFAGDGDREVAVAYVQETPVWKTSYRLVIPEAQGAAQPRQEMLLQAWAIVENTSDEDWRDVRLSLVSGRPVSFTMDLYEPLYAPRMSLPVPTEPGVSPRGYAAGGDPRAAESEALLRATTGAPTPAAAPMADMAPGAPARRGIASAGRPGMPGGGSGGEMGREIALGQAMRESTAAVAEGTASGEVFQFEVQTPVTIERQRSAMLPIISQNIQGRRVSIVSPGDSSPHPMRGLQITNSSALPLMPGPVAVFDGSTYAGDASIMHVAPGDSRLLSYALDLDVIRTTRDSSSDTITRVKIVRGVFEMTIQSRMTTTYQFENKDKTAPRLLIIEHPRLGGWTLVNPEKPAEQTESLLRFELPLEAGKSAALDVSQEITRSEFRAVLDFDARQLAQLVQSGKASPAVQQAFARAAELRAQVAEAERRVAQIEKDRNDITSDQGRIRQNMQAVDRTSQLYNRYVAQLSAQEDRMAQLAGDLDQAQTALAAARKALEDYISALNVE